MHAYRAGRESPFGRLSNELVNEIFISSFILEPPYSQSISLRLSHVCAHWREIAISNWRLWNEITLPKWWSESEMRELLVWTKELTRRTRDAPIHLSILAYDWTELWDDMVTTFFLELEDRVRKIELTMHYNLEPCTRRLMAAISQTKAPLLDSILIVTISNQGLGTLSRLTQPRENIKLTNIFPKLRSVTYSEIMTSNILPGSSLGSITRFTASLIFSTMQDLSQWLEIFKSMPSLEDLHLSFWRPVIKSSTTSDTPTIYLGRLKNFYMCASHQECAELCKYLKLPPKCTFGIECTELSSFGLNNIYTTQGVSEEAIHQLVLRWSEETCLDVFDKHLEININTRFLRVAICSLALALPHRPIMMLKFSFSLGWGRNVSDNLEDIEQNYLSLVNSIRMIHSIRLTDAAEVSLRVDQQSLFEGFAAPVLGPLVRSCHLAQKLRLTGSMAMFMVPILKNRIMNRGEHDFDFSFFANNATWNFPEYLQNVIAAIRPEEGRRSMRSYLTPTPEEEKKYCMRENLLEISQMKSIEFLYSEFDVTMLEGHIQLLNVILWFQNQSRVLQELLQILRAEPESPSNYTFRYDDWIENTKYDTVVEKASRFGLFNSDINFERDFGQWFNPDDVGI